MPDLEIDPTEVEELYEDTEIAAAEANGEEFDYEDNMPASAQAQPNVQPEQPVQQTLDKGQPATAPQAAAANVEGWDGQYIKGSFVFSPVDGHSAGRMLLIGAQVGNEPPMFRTMREEDFGKFPAGFTRMMLEVREAYENKHKPKGATDDNDLIVSVTPPTDSSTTTAKGKAAGSSKKKEEASAAPTEEQAQQQLAAFNF
jgi:hypothetical protein